MKITNKIIISGICLSLLTSIFTACYNHKNINAIKDDLIRQSVQSAILFLVKNQHSNGQITLINSDEFNVWETILATRAMLLWHNKGVNIEDSVIEKSLVFLKNSETINGMVLHCNSHEGSYCVETSSEYIRLLAIGNDSNKEEAIKKSAFILNKQLPTGQWKINNMTIPEHLQLFPSVTGFALRAITSTKSSPVFIDSALFFLIKSQNKEGNWGFPWQYYGTPFYAMDPILATLRYYNVNGRFDKVINNSKHFLTKSQKKDGSFFIKLKENQNMPSRELQTALGIKSLLYCDVSFNDDRITNGIKWLLSNQRADGCWNGGMFPAPGKEYKKKEDIFCTAEVLFLFYEYLKFKNVN